MPDPLYIVLLPGLVMATHFLKSPRALSFIDGWLCARGDEQTTPDFLTFWRGNMSVVHKATANAPEKSKVLNFLAALAQNSTIAIRVLGRDNYGSSVSHLHWQCRDMARGHQFSIIYLSRTLIGTLHVTDPPLVLLRAWLRVAVVLLHEIAHCLSYFTGTAEKYFEDQARLGPPEMGWAFEKHVFGCSSFEEMGNLEYLEQLSQDLFGVKL